MSVIYKCLHCGKAIKSDCVFEGPISKFQKYIDDKTKELSEKCECRKKCK